MQKLLVLSIVALFSLQIASAQEKKPLPETILEAPESWRPELFSFPLPFAPTINFSGVEDIRFSKGWADSTQTDFWTYAFVWYLDADPELNTEKLEGIMQDYFDGLMKAVAPRNNVPEASITKTKATFEKNADEITYTGKIVVFDGFFQLSPMTLQVYIHQRHCTVQDKYIVRFNLSPRQPSDPVWKTFEEVVLKVPCGK